MYLPDREPGLRFLCGLFYYLRVFVSAPIALFAISVVVHDVSVFVYRIASEVLSVFRPPVTILVCGVCQCHGVSVAARFANPAFAVIGGVIFVLTDIKITPMICFCGSGSVDHVPSE